MCLLCLIISDYLCKSWPDSCHYIASLGYSKLNIDDYKKTVVMVLWHYMFLHCINKVNEKGKHAAKVAYSFLSLFLIVSARDRPSTLTYPNIFTLQPAWPWPSASQWHVRKEAAGVTIDESWRRLKFMGNWKNRVKNMESWRRLKAETLSKREVPTRNWKEKEKGNGKEKVENGKANISVRAGSIRNGREVENVGSTVGNW